MNKFPIKFRPCLHKKIHKNLRSTSLRDRSTFLTTQLSLDISFPLNQKEVWVERVLSE